MAKRTGGAITPLGSLGPGDSGDCFVLLSSKDRGSTRDGKPFFRVGFRDPERSVTVMVWRDTPWFEQCESSWQPGSFFKIRCSYYENQYGPQIELERIRPVEKGDEADGFDPAEFFERTRFDVDEMWQELVAIAKDEIGDKGLRKLVLTLLKKHEAKLKTMSAASRNHHAYTGGYLEHVLSVTKTCRFLAGKYAEYYSELEPPLNVDLVIAGGILHDIGKMLELDHQPGYTEYTARGVLIGHILLGRDLVRETALELGELSEELLLRLEHLIVSHQGIPEYGSPVVPHTPEALLVHFADDLDAKYNMLANAIGQTPESEEFSSRDNPLRRRIFRGLNASGD